jgi:pimeloyl-ACP methyl ester carboxylesterase
MSAGPASRLVAGRGEPVTVFAPGLAAGIADTRPFGGAVAGTRVFFEYRGHGADRVGYDSLADDLLAVADRYGATRAVGISLGAGALCRLLAGRPDRFERLAFVLPAALDPAAGPTEAGLHRMRTLTSAVATRDEGTIARALMPDLPVSVHETRTAGEYLRRRVRALLTEGLPPLREELPLADRRVLARVGASALVLGAHGDRVHPVRVARELAAALPHATLHLLGEGGVLWQGRDELRSAISTFLNRVG